MSVEYPIWGKLYIYVFVGTFYLAIANICIVLIESAHMISLRLLYHSRGEGQSNSLWTSLGVEFARYARRVVSMTSHGSSSNRRRGSGSSVTGAEESSVHGARSDLAFEQRRRIDALEAKLEASLAQQAELLRQLLARTPGA